nr:hypothetical protein [Rhodococcus sp. (in: high G+C Gram-positive bacteria)]
MDWIAALLVWFAAGARVGRVVVRNANTVRVAIVVAVCFLAAAHTVGIDDVARSLDRLGDANSALAVCWTGFSAASAVVAIHAWPSIPTGRHRVVTAFVAALGIAAMVGSLLSPTVGWVFVLVSLPVVVFTGARVLDRTPVGHAVGLYCLGACFTIAVAVTVLFGASPNRTVLTVGTLTTALGAVWVLLGTWLRARVLLFRIKDLHRTLVRRFPEVIDDSRSGAPTVLRAADHVSDTMDALYLLVGAGQYDDDPIPPESPSTRAALLARTVRDPLAHPVLGTGWVVAPEDMSLAQWVTLVAASAAGPADSSEHRHVDAEGDPKRTLRRAVRRNRR